MVQVMSKPREFERKSNEVKRIKETLGAGIAPKAELQAVRFEWPGLQVGSGSEVLFYKPNQRRSGNQPQGIQSAIWVPNSHGTPWQYGGVNEDMLANGHPGPSPTLGYNMKHVLACAGLMLMMVTVLRLLDYLRPLTIFRSRRTSQVQNTLKIICQMPEKQTTLDLPSTLDNLSNDYDKSSMYLKNIDFAVDALMKNEKLYEHILPYTCVFTSGKGKVPRLYFFDPRKDLEVAEIKSIEESQDIQINVPTEVYVNDEKKEKANVLIEINDPESESGCIIGMDMLVNRDDDDVSIIDDSDDLSMITIDKVDDSDDLEETEQPDEDAQN